MSSNSGLMDTDVGGENTQYESIKTVTNPPSQQGGQLSSETGTNTKDTPSKERGDQTAENVRYGQAMSEQGVGGFTSPDQNSGSAGEGKESKVGRKEMGYDAGKEMNRNIGA
ncbi:hypothetical protein EJ08DRAFT_698989 [Tothia fuscella]|uniref:Uncharacterized protein n=1 Tax=Tothia fuscella TaxID=1048955 RepID=A0A9P4TW09_9PEZI|nr:hypothetical protein EJ08DRAFT_698989 [Tothia fuscella]